MGLQELYVFICIHGITSVALSEGSLRNDATEYRHADISVHTWDAEQDIPVAKPAKLQNL
jgi:hypothetical protein